MRQLWGIRRGNRWLLSVGLTIGLGWGLAIPYAGASDDHPLIVTSSNADASSPAAIAMEPDKRWGSSVATPVESKVLLRTLPSLSKQFSFGGTTLVPYIGAGFRGGYATEYDRSLNTAQSPSFSSSGPADVGLRSLAGHMIPNEVQLGVRFPF